MLFLFIYGINRQISACEPPPKGGEDFYLTTLAEMIFLIDKCIIVVVSLQVVSFIKLRLSITLCLTCTLSACSNSSSKANKASTGLKVKYVDATVTYAPADLDQLALA